MAVVNDLIRQRACDAVEALSRMARVRAAYLFGSHVAGTADEYSDIDIAAFIEDIEEWDIRRRTRAMVATQKEVGDDVELHFFSADLLDNAPKASFAAYTKSHGVLIE